MKIRLALYLLSCLVTGFGGVAGEKNLERPFLESELIFPLEHWHNHASCIVECPNGDLLVCWFHGSGERTADDVVVRGARKRMGERCWSAPFVMSDTPGYPDTNPTMFIDPQKRLWLLWSTILDNRWDSALVKCRISSDYQKSGPPKWGVGEVLHVTPGTNFQELVATALDQMVAAPQSTMPAEKVEKWIQHYRARLTNTLSCRLGWMTRAHPYVLEGRRVIAPLYSDAFNFSLMAITDDWGETWSASTPLVGVGNVQPSLVRKRDGTLVAYMRDNGPRPHRLQVSESRDCGVTWSQVVDSDRPDPGAGVEVIALQSGLWLLINNDLDEGRHRLGVSLSDDEGKTWKWTRHLERDTDVEIKTGGGSYHYPSIIQARDGTIHASYSFFQKQRETKLDPNGKPARKAIKHAHFNEAWVMQGDAP